VALKSGKLITRCMHDLKVSTIRLAAHQMEHRR
jgi:hypothetical protein